MTMDMSNCQILSCFIYNVDFTKKKKKICEYCITGIFTTLVARHLKIILFVKLCKISSFLVFPSKKLF